MENGDQKVSQLTKREYIATRMMQALIASPDKYTDWNHIRQVTARVALRYADSLLEEMGEEAA